MKNVLVTGASTGIGFATALHLDRLGHHVFAGVRKEADAERLRERASDRLVPVFLDVTDQGQIDAVAKQISEASGGLYGLVNNAGVGRGGPIEFIDVDEWRQQLEVNVIGQVAVTRAVLPLIRRERGRIVFIGSVGGRVATMMTGPYNASKFAIEAIGDALRQELHPWRIPVAIVEPGAIKTEIWEKGRQTAERLERELPEEARRLYAAHISTARKGIDMQDRRGVGPEKVAAVVQHALFSTRPKTRYLVGTDARVMALLARLVPDRPRDAVLRLLLRP